MKQPYVFACTGGGMRGISVAGVLQKGSQLGKFLPEQFDVMTGDSFGALIVALVANGWSPEKIADFLVETDFKKLLIAIPWGLRKPLLMVNPISLKKVAGLIDRLDLRPNPRVLINTWDAEKNRQVIYCEKKPEWAVSDPAIPVVWEENAFSQWGYGTLITRSMALPGLVADALQWMDGGISEHPPLSFLPVQSSILLINLGFAGLVSQNGDTTPKSLIDRAMYAYEVTAFVRQKLMLGRFNHCFEMDPHIYDVDSMAFNLSRQEKRQLILRAEHSTEAQWKTYQPEEAR